MIMNPDTIGLRSEENIKQVFLLCGKCNKYIPFIRIKQIEAIVVVDIDCKQRYQMPIADYMASMKQLTTRKQHLCTQRDIHSCINAVIYCAICTKWLCYECNINHKLFGLDNHQMIPCEIIMQSWCSIHNSKSYKAYCNECSESLCKICMESHKNNKHSVITYDTLLSKIKELDLNSIKIQFETIMKRNKSYRDDMINKIDTQIKLFNNLKGELLSAYGVNVQINETINELLLTAFSNYELMQCSSYELLKNITYLYTISNSQPICKTSMLETNCNDLLDYYKHSYIINIDHKIAYSDGRIYEGGYVNEQIEGYGVYRWPDGSQYKGQFKNGKINGQGIYSWSNGDIYDGEWVDGKSEGYGISRSNGNQYIGQYKNGKKTAKECTFGVIKGYTKGNGR